MPGDQPGIRALEKTVSHLLNHASRGAEALRMNAMSTLSSGNCAADTDRRFEAASLAVSAAEPVRFVRAYEAARDSTTDEMIGRFYDGTVQAVVEELWTVGEPAAHRAAADAFEAAVIEGDLPDSPSDLRWKIHDACRDAVSVKGQWAARLEEEVIDAAAESINEMTVRIIGSSARTARTGPALCAATTAMLESSWKRSLKNALKDAHRAIPEYASAAINDEAGFDVLNLLEEMSRQTRRCRGAGA